MLRRCPCGARIAAWNYGRHRRGDACKARPLPCPERCSCGCPWPCLSCDVATLIRAGHSLPAVARLFGITVRRAYKEWHRWELRFRGRKRRAGHGPRTRPYALYPTG